MTITYQISDDASALNEWFPLYWRCFEDVHQEAETREGFEEAFALNVLSPSRDLGHHTEVALLAYLDGELVGGAQYLLLDWEGGWSCALNYVFVAPKHRGRGIAADILRQVELLVPARPIFIEHKPGITLWNKLGAVIIDPSYQQPALRPGETSTPLVLSVIREATKVLTEEHLLRYQRFSCEKRP